MASTKLHTLNSDILCEILLSCSTLSDLYCLIRTHPNIYTVFHTRRRQVLRSVYRTQHQNSALCGKTWQDRIDQDSVDAFFKGLNNRCKNAIDHVALREALWHQHYQPYVPSSERAIKSASSLLKWYEKAGLQQEAFQFASKTLKAILRKPSSTSLETQEFVRLVARIYGLENRTRELIRATEATLKRLPHGSLKHIFWIKCLVGIYRAANNATYSEPLLTLLRDNWDSYSTSTKGPATEDAKYLARELLTEYTSHDHSDDAAAALAICRTVRDATTPGSPEHIAWSRQMIRLHRKTGNVDGVVHVMEEALRPLQHASKFYRIWTEELAREYETTGRPHDAIAVWESAWAAIAATLARHPNQNEWRFDGKGAALILVKLYRRYGRDGDAVALEARCNELGIVLS
ncbi:hypothetical protein DM02DRAFT_62963 [Periconia macrospinosa]|uniref:Uncharacterized protein n=1 Tax=Periconia macrospinosa TaxID=97972 RepID=A0A2V1DJ44_9PLEO|nr:hypothetical protein DM02DRAFT_62963 [Periconia macrospinosa]